MLERRFLQNIARMAFGLLLLAVLALTLLPHAGAVTLSGVPASREPAKPPGAPLRFDGLFGQAVAGEVGPVSVLSPAELWP